jgi:uncharacterized protein DUF6508
MKTELSTKADIEELLRFLPLLYEDDFNPIKKWHGGEKENGVLIFPYPEYQPIVEDFFKVTSKICWELSSYNKF